MRTKNGNRKAHLKGRSVKILFLATVVLILLGCTAVGLLAYQPGSSAVKAGDARLPGGRVRFGVWGLLLTSGLLGLFASGGRRGEGKSGVAFEDTCRFFFEESPIANIILSLDGTIRDLNASGLAALGHRERSELTGRSILEFVVPEHGPRLAHLLGERDGDVPPKAEVDILARGGPARTFLFSRCRAASSGKGDAAHALVAGVDVTDRELVRENELRSTQHLEFLSETAMGFVELSPQEEVHRFIGQKLARLVPEAAYVIVNSIDREKRRLQVRCVLGSGKLVDLAARAIGRDPAGMSFDVHDEVWQGLSGGRLVRIPGGLYELAFAQVPKAVCSAVEKLADIGDIYVMGFSKKEEVYGSAAIMLRWGVRLTNQTVIETFMRQAGVALQRRQAEDELQKEREKLEWATENAGVGLAIISKDYRTLWANQVLKRMFGDVEGKPCHLTYNQRTEVCPGCGVRELFKTGQDQVVHEQVGKDKEGKTMWSQIIVTPVRDAQRNVTAALEAVVPITERKQNERLQGVLYRIANAANTAGDLDELFRIIRKELLLVLDTTNFFVALYDQKTGSLSLPYHVDQKDRFTSFPPGKTLTSWILRNDSPLLCTPEVRRRLLEAGEIEQTGTPSLAWLGVPLKVDSETIGVLGVQSYTDPSAYGTRELEILRFASEQIALAIRRKQAEEALKRSERDYRGLFESAHDAILIFEPEGETVLDVNRMACEVYGFERSEFVGMSLERISQDIPKGKEHIRLTLEKGSYHRFETVQYRKDGSRMFLEVNASVVDYMGRRAILSINRDITERKQAEEALRSSEQRYQLLFQQNLAGVYQTTLDGKVIDCNQSFARLLGYESREQVLSRNASEFYFDPAERENFLSGLQSKGSLTDYEFLLRRKDGGAVWILENVNLVEGSGTTPTVIQGTSIDITQRKLAEEALRRSEDRYRSLFQDSPISLWEEDFSEVKRHLHHLRDTGISDFRRHFEDHPEEVARCATLVKVIDVNKGSMNLYQARSAEQLKSALDQIMAKEEYQPFKEELICIAEGRTSFESEAATYTLTGGKRHVIMRWTVLPGYEETLSRVVVAMTDITARRRAQEELEEEKERYRNLFETASDSITTLNTKGFITSCNAATERVTGFSREEVIGRHFSKVGTLRVRDLPKYLRSFGSIIRGRLPRPIELEAVRKDGSTYLAEAHVSLLKEGGKIAGVQVITHDITMRKRAEEQIAYQAQLLAIVNDAVVASDAQYRLTAWNAAAESMYGWKAEEVLGRFGLDITRTEFPGVDKAEMLRAIAERGSWYGEATQARKDGTRFPVEVSSVVLRDATGKVTGFVSVNRDITERRQAEEALRLSEARLKRAQAMAHIGNWDWNIKENTLVWSEELHRIFGVKQTDFEFSFEAIENLIHPEDRDLNRRYVKRLLDSADSGEYAFRIVRPDGEIRHMNQIFDVVRNERGETIRAFGTMQDVSERRRAEEALRESEEKYRLVSENIPVVVYSALPDEHSTNLFVSGKIEELTGYSDAEFLGNPQLFGEMIHPEDRHYVWKKVEEHRRKKGPLDVEYRIRTKDGVVKWIRDSATPMLDEEGRMTRINGFMEDVTERRLAEEALRESQERYRTLFGKTANPILVIDDQGNYIDGNQAALDFLEWTRDQLLSKNIRDTIPPGKERQMLDKHLPLWENGGVVETEYYLGGAIKILELTITPSRWEDRRVIFGVGKDVTDRKRAEEVSRKSQAKLQSIFSAAPTGIGMTIDQTVKELNTRLCEITGYSKEELLGGSVSVVYPSDEDYQSTRREIYKQLTEKGNSITETCWRGKDGRLIHVLLNCAPLEPSDLSQGITFAVLDITERKRAEEALVESEGRYRLLANNVSDVIWTMDLNFKFTYYSPSIKQALGYTPEEVISKRIDEVLTPASYKFVMEAIAEEMEMEKKGEGDLLRSRTIEVEEVRKDKTTIWVEIKASFLRDAKGKALGILGVTRDITERKRAEEALKKSVQLLRDTGEMAQVGGWELDLSTKEVSWTEEVGRIHGIEPGYKPKLEEALNFYAPESRPALEEVLKKAAETGEPYDLESLFIPSGSKDKIWVRSLGRAVYSGGKIVKLAGTFQNIDKYKRAEEEIRKLTQYLESIIDNANVWLDVLDVKANVMIWNRAAEKISRYSREEVVGHGKIWEWLYPDEEYRNQITAKAAAIIEKGEEVEDFETTIRCKNGRIRTISWHSRNLVDEKGVTIGSIALGRDITEKKKMEAQLIQSERLASVGTLAYGIAHEFNNILAGILGNAEFGMGNDDRQEVEECFRVIMENCDRARSITNHLLAFARRREGKKEMTDLTDTVESVLGLTERELQKENIKVKRSFDPVPEIFCDPGELSEVFLNMITNARDAMKPDGGTLTISIGQKGDDLQVTFRDTGCGIPDIIKGRIFEPFVTTKGALGQSEIPGTGLGLFLSIGIVTRYHGRIDVESREGKGSTFTITFPVSENQMTPGDVDAAKKEPVSVPRNLRILLVDDEEPICNATRNSLEADGHFVVSTTSGKMGLKLFKAGAFDLVLSDITMPDMDGVKLISAIKAQDPQVKLIAVTGHVQEDKLAAAEKAGADQILTKPFRKDDLLKTMSRVLSSHE